jgi:hypothetical protein
MNNRPPGKGNKLEGESQVQSRVISARLHPADEYERAALKTFDEKVDEGFSPRAILTDALNHAAGRTPEMFRREGRIDSAVERLESELQKLESGNMDAMLEKLMMLLEGKLTEFLKSIRSTDREGLQRFANSEDEDEEMEFPDEFVRNVKKAARKSFRQKQRDQDDD